jgi:hypothetical protein
MRIAADEEDGHVVVSASKRKPPTSVGAKCLHLDGLREEIGIDGVKRMVCDACGYRVAAEEQRLIAEDVGRTKPPGRVVDCLHDDGFRDEVGENGNVYVVCDTCGERQDTAKDVRDCSLPPNVMNGSMSPTVPASESGHRPKRRSHLVPARTSTENAPPIGTEEVPLTAVQLSTDEVSVKSFGSPTENVPAIATEAAPPTAVPQSTDVVSLKPVPTDNTQTIAKKGTPPTAAQGSTDEELLKFLGAPNENASPISTEDRVTAEETVAKYLQQGETRLCTTQTVAEVLNAALIPNAIQDAEHRAAEALRAAGVSLYAPDAAKSQDCVLDQTMRPSDDSLRQTFQKSLELVNACAAAVSTATIGTALEVSPPLPAPALSSLAPSRATFQDVAYTGEPSAGRTASSPLNSDPLGRATASVPPASAPQAYSVDRVTEVRCEWEGAFERRRREIQLDVDSRVAELMGDGGWRAPLTATTCTGHTSKLEGPRMPPVESAGGLLAGLPTVGAASSSAADPIAAMSGSIVVHGCDPHEGHPPQNALACNRPPLSPSCAATVHESEEERSDPSLSGLTAPDVFPSCAATRWDSLEDHASWDGDSVASVALDAPLADTSAAAAEILLGEASELRVASPEPAPISHGRQTSCVGSKFPELSDTALREATSSLRDECAALRAKIRDRKTAGRC